ncbi:MAG TPA: hypothetical protein VMW15_10075 [Terracidiphilus sp.]|nr:hypothetical protein [Terracidiphilus sp.]
MSRPASGADEAAHTPRLLVAGFGENRCGRQPSTTAAVFEHWHCVGVLSDWIGIEVTPMYDVVVPLGPFSGTHELLPCGLLGGDLVKLFRKNESKYYWYDFTVRGERHRGSTKETNETRAQKAAALKLAAAIKGSDPLDRKPPMLREYSKDFLQWVETGRLESDSRRYYRNGWRLLEQTKIAGMRMDQITKGEIEKLKFPGSASNGNNALRTLRRMYSKASQRYLKFASTGRLSNDFVVWTRPEEGDRWRHSQSCLAACWSLYTTVLTEWGAADKAANLVG